MLVQMGALEIDRPKQAVGAASRANDRGAKEDVKHAGTHENQKDTAQGEMKNATKTWKVGGHAGV